MNFVGALLICVFLAERTVADSCKSCRGSACMADNVFEIDCKQYVPPLPFESKLPKDVAQNTKYGCLDLEYYIGDSLEQLQQCVMSSNVDAYCTMLETSLKVESCSIEAPKSGRTVRKVAEFADEDEGATEDPPVPTTIQPNAGNGAATSLVSAVVLASVIFLML